jgi:hypothetical protein
MRLRIEVADYRWVRGGSRKILTGNDARRVQQALNVEDIATLWNLNLDIKDVAPGDTVKDSVDAGWLREPVFTGLELR